MDENAQEIVHTTIRISRGLRKRVRVAAAEREVSMDALIQEAIEKLLGPAAEAAPKQPARKHGT